MTSATVLRTDRSEYDDDLWPPVGISCRRTASLRRVSSRRARRLGVGRVLNPRCRRDSCRARARLAARRSTAAAPWSPRPPRSHANVPFRSPELMADEGDRRTVRCPCLGPRSSFQSPPRRHCAGAVSFDRRRPYPILSFLANRGIARVPQLENLNAGFGTCVPISLPVSPSRMSPNGKQVDFMERGRGRLVLSLVRSLQSAVDFLTGKMERQM